MDASTSLLYGIIFVYVFCWLNNRTVVSQKIKNEGQPAVDAWLETLKKGGSVSPVELANIAGVDITTEQPLKSTIQYISDLVDEVEKLTDEIEQANN